MEAISQFLPDRRPEWTCPLPLRARLAPRLCDPSRKRK